jgi:hypothetical protein
LLLNSLINDALGKLPGACAGYDKIIKEKRIRNNHLKGVICLLAGVMFRRNDEYDKALKYFEKANKYFVDNDFFKGVLNSNLGALCRLKNQFSDAIAYYNAAITIFHNCGDRLAESEMYLMLSRIKDEEGASKGKPLSSEGFDLHRRAMYLKPKNDYYLPNIHLLYGYQYFVDEEFESLAHLYSVRHSNDIFNGNREFRWVQQFSDILGAFLTTSSAQIQNAICLFNIATRLRDPLLLQNALTYFIITDYDKGIQGAYNGGLDNISKLEIDKILSWCMSIKGDRYAILGRLDFIRVFADVIPEKYIGKVFNLCLQGERLGYSFNNNFDYGRKAVAALEAICNRLNKRQLHLLLKVMLKNLDKNDWFVIDAKLNLLSKMHYDKLENKDLQMIYSAMNDSILGKVRTRDPWMVYQIWTQIAQMCTKQQKRKIYSKLNTEFNKEVEQANNPNVDFKYYNLNVGIYLTYDFFKEMRTEEQNKLLVGLLCKKLEEERIRETLTAYAIGGFWYVDGLARLYPTVSKKIKKTILTHLLQYATAENLIPRKRTLAIKSIISLASYIKKDDQNRIHKAMKYLIEEKEYVTNNTEGITPQEYFDNSLLKTLALMSIAVYNYPKSEWMIEKTMLLSLHPSEQSLPHLIRCVYEILKRSKNRQQIDKLCTILFFHLNNQDNTVSSLSLRYLADSSTKLPDSYNKVLADVIDRLKTSQKYEIRRSVAYAVQKMISTNSGNKKYFRSIINELKDDVHYSVRYQANQLTS